MEIFLAGNAETGKSQLALRAALRGEQVMALKPNYRQERTQRTRSRELKKQEKQRRREEASSKRKAVQARDSNMEPAGNVGDRSEGLKP
jgi:hypothetical protein